MAAGYVVRDVARGGAGDAAPAGARSGDDGAGERTGAGVTAGRKAADAEPRLVPLSNLKKVFWPDQGYTKCDLIAYYDAAAPLMLPYLKERPAVLTRDPDGINGKSVFQKEAPVVQQGKPEVSTLASRLDERGGKVYVDGGKNGHGVAIVAPCWLRPVPAASASCPLRWGEVKGKLGPARFKLRTLPKRFEKME